MAGRIRTFLSDNIVFVVGIPLIGSFHWCWLQLQKIDKLVPPEQRNLEQPIVRAFKKFSEKFSDRFLEKEPDLDNCPTTSTPPSDEAKH